MFQTGGQLLKLLDKATNQTLLEPDWGAIIQICDLIRQNDVQPRTVLNALKKKLQSTNPHCALYALQVLESIVKNCPVVQDELTTKAYCEFLHDLTKTTQHENVRAKLLELIQAWSVAFRKNPKHSAIKDIMVLMKAEGFKFSTVRESDAMFSADTAPEWLDGDTCHRCRDTFTLLVRKHHCRACGQVFCGKCTSKTTTLPKYGIEKEVRVCDTCYAEVTKPISAKLAQLKAESELPIEYLTSSLAQQNQEPKKNEDDLREEEELQIAIALSQSEAEAKEKEKFKFTSNYSFKAKEIIADQPERAPSPQEEQNPELQRYLNRNFWESRQINDNKNEQNTPASPSAPATAPLQNKDVIKYGDKENDVVNNDLDHFMKALKGQVEVFINRMKSNSSRGRSIANDTSVQSLFMNITDMHSKLLRYIQEHDDARIYFERLQDKLTQVKDARDALDSLRDEHLEKLRREAEEAERIRQMQMLHKLDLMRKKKQEFLQYQRQVALQRIQEQEREMAMRQEQQKQHYILPQYGYMGSPMHGQQFPGNIVSTPGSYHTYPYQGHVIHPAQQGGLPQQGQMPHNPAFVQATSIPTNPAAGIPQSQYGHTLPGHGHPLPPPGLSAVGIPPNQNVIPSSQAGLPPNSNIPQNQGMIAAGQTVPHVLGIPPGQGIPQGQGIPHGQVIHQGQGIPHGQGIPQGQGISQGQGGIPTNQNQIPLQGQVPPGFQQQPQAGPPVQQQPKVEAQTAELISFD